MRVNKGLFMHLNTRAEDFGPIYAESVSSSTPSINSRRYRGKYVLITINSIGQKVISKLNRANT